MTYELLKTALDVASSRQKAISSNLANIHTPGYKTNRVDFEKYLTKALHEKNLTKTHDGHISITTNHPLVKKQEMTSVQDDGNNVDIDYEMAELSANNIYYEAVVSQLNAKYMMMRSIIK